MVEIWNRKIDHFEGLWHDDDDDDNDDDDDDDDNVWIVYPYRTKIGQ